MLNDDPETKPLLKFDAYSTSLVDILMKQDNISIGIFGEWGTGKTTLMKSIERKLNDHVLDWQKVETSDKPKMLNYLTKFGINWREEDTLVTSSENLITLHNNLEHRKISLRVSSTKDNSSSKFSRVMTSLFEITKDIAKENDVIKNYIKEKSKQIILEIDGNPKDQFLGYIDTNNQFTIYLLEFDQECIITCWFNPWKFELEEGSISNALIKRIAFSIINHPAFFSLKPLLMDLTKKFLGKLSEEAIHKILSFATNDSEKFLKDVQHDLFSIAFENEKKSIYYDGGILLEKHFELIRNKYPSSKIIVFVDDLDRCSLKTVVELFESIKVVLDLKGFSYVVGLSDKRVQRVLASEYSKIGFSPIESKESAQKYINKVIHIPFLIQDFSSDSMFELVKIYCDQIDSPDVTPLLLTLSDFLIQSCRFNPRDLKKLLNFIKLNLYEFERISNLSSYEALIILIFYYSWNDLYKSFTVNDYFRVVFNNFMRLHIEDILYILEGQEYPKNELFQSYYYSYLIETKERYDQLGPESQNLMKSIPYELWKFFIKESNLLLRIPWDEFSQSFIKKDVKKEIEYDPRLDALATILQSRFDYYYFTEKKYVPALRVSNQLLEINNNISNYHNLKGLCLYALGEIEKAIENYERAYEIENLIFYANNIGNACLALSELEPSNSHRHIQKAIKFFTLALNTEPTNIPTLHQIARSYYLLRDYENSMAYYDRILSIDANNIDAIGGKSGIHHDKKEYNAAILLLEGIITQERLSSFIYLGIASSLEAQFYLDNDVTHIKKAKDYLKKSLEYYPNDIRAEQFLSRLNGNHPHIK
jgi:tetratricopeptide (TPR) repeat protein